MWGGVHQLCGRSLLVVPSPLCTQRQHLRQVPPAHQWVQPLFEYIDMRELFGWVPFEWSHMHIVQDIHVGLLPVLVIGHLPELPEWVLSECWRMLLLL